MKWVEKMILTSEGQRNTEMSLPAL